MGDIHVSASKYLLISGVATARNQVDECGLGAPFD
jgi:hypothetical protein